MGLFNKCEHDFQVKHIDRKDYYTPPYGYKRHKTIHYVCAKCKKEKHDRQILNPKITYIGDEDFTGNIEPSKEQSSSNLFGGLRVVSPTDNDIK